MKEYFIVLLGLIFGFVIFDNFVDASNVGLIENSTWQGNLTPTRFSSLAAGDINNDGYADLILTGCLSSGALRCDAGVISKIYINNGTTLLENSTWQQNLTGVGLSSIAIGDIDNDGDLDLIISGCDNASDPNLCTGNIIIKIYINNGTTLLENSTWQQNLTGVGPGSLAFGDIDNDGDLDLVLKGTSINGYISKVYTNNGSSFAENSTWQQNLTNVGRSGSISLGDIDNDGDMDIHLTGWDGSSDHAKIYINSGTTFIENQTWQQNLTGWGWSSNIFGDYDDDGNLDMIRSGTLTGDHLWAFKNNGTTLLVDQKSSGDGGAHLVGLFQGSLGFGDYDNDGNLDLAAMGRNMEAGRDRIYENNGIIFIVDSTATENITNDTKDGSLIWFDIDQDDDLDLIMIGSSTVFGLIAKIYMNNITTPNTIPNPPSSDFNTTFNFSTGKLTLSWGNGSDVETPTLGLYYNLHVGTCSGCHDVVSGIYGGSSNPTAGYFGNMMQRRRIVLNRPDLENKTIYWAVQTIDTGLAKSAWSAEQVFNITQAPPSCTENWTYGEWSSCISGQQTRTATDSNNCGTAINRSAVVQSCSSAPSGGNPADSSPPPSAPAQNKTNIFENVTWYFEKINADVDTGFIVNESGLAVNQLWIKVKNEVREVAIDIKKLPDKPDFVSKGPEGKVYQYLNITTTNLSDTNVEIGKIRFRTEKSWIENNSINVSSVYLLRYYGSEWQKLKTEFKSEDSEFVYYLAETPGFSIFAIAGKILKEAGMVCVPMEMRCNGSKLEECSVDGSEWVTKKVCDYGCEDGGCKEKPRVGWGFDYTWVVVPLVTIVIVITVLYFSKIKNIRHKPDQVI